ncbi:hypothetical protein D3C78_1970760 [compost metagenome]
MPGMALSAPAVPAIFIMPLRTPMSWLSFGSKAKEKATRPVTPPSASALAEALMPAS